MTLLTQEQFAIKETATLIHNDEKFANKAGQKLVEMLALKRSPTNKNRWKTSWGDKTDAGLARSIITILEGMDRDNI